MTLYEVMCALYFNALSINDQISVITTTILLNSCQTLRINGVYYRRLFLQTSCVVSTGSPTNRSLSTERSTEVRRTKEGTRLFYFVTVSFVI